MAVEIQNQVHALALFTADNPAVLTRGEGVTAVTRTGVGTYKAALAQKVVAGSVQCHVNIGPIASPGICVAYWSVDADGDIAIETRNATVAADIAAPISLLVLAYPTNT